MLLVWKFESMTCRITGLSSSNPRLAVSQACLVRIHDLPYLKPISYSGLGGEESLFAERNVSQVAEAVAELGCNHPSPAPGYFGHSLRPFVKMATTKSLRPPLPPRSYLWISDLNVLNPECQCQRRGIEAKPHFS